MPNKKETSKVASKASEILKNPKSTKEEKSVAGSDLGKAKGKGNSKARK